MKHRGPRSSHPGFTLLELLVSVSVIALLLAMLLPTLGAAREQARAVVCASNLRQIVLANFGYSGDERGHLCPGARDIQTNLHRWHGVRGTVAAPFDAAHGPLARYLGEDARIRACPSQRDFIRQFGAFEQGNGGYGYNQAYVGRVLQRVRGSTSYGVRTDAAGARIEMIRRPAATLLFADTAFAGVVQGVIEYSFAEPRFHPEYLAWAARADPSLHFRHRGRVQVAWGDGHVDGRPRTFSYQSGWYAGDAVAAGLGWFGEADDNGYFDLE